MTGKELDILIRKILEGRASPDEISYLEELERDAESGVSPELFNDRDERETGTALFGRINKAIRDTAKYNWWRYASAAAIFIGFITSGYYFWQPQESESPFQHSPNAITLEHEDGSIEVLQEQGTKEVIDRTGKIVGIQNGSLITYEDTGNLEELVYNTLNVPYGKRFELTLSDGTQVHLNAGTSLKYPIKFLNGQPRRVFLNGEAFFAVSKDSLHPFTVKAGELDVRVLGTRFNVSSYPENKRTDVVLVEGSVGMNIQTKTFEKKSSTVLKPGFMGTFHRINGKISKEPVVTDIYTSWMDGELVFRNLSFENMLRRLERHYNVSISIKNNGLAQEIFNASYGRVTLEKVLEDLKLTYGIHYSIKGEFITIY